MLDGLIFKKANGAWDAPYKIGDLTGAVRCNARLGAILLIF